jgi:hypothetical protein
VLLRNVGTWWLESGNTTLQADDSECGLCNASGLANCAVSCPKFTQLVKLFYQTNSRLSMSDIDQPCVANHMQEFFSGITNICHLWYIIN